MTSLNLRIPLLFGLVSLASTLWPPMPMASGAQVPTPTPTSTVAPVRSSSSLGSQLADTLEGRDGDYGLVVENLDTAERVALAADQPFRMGSVYKVLVAYAVLREVEAGRLSLDQPLVLTEDDNLEGEPAAGLELNQTVTVRQAAAAMLGVSSNLAAHRLLRLLGRANFNHVLAGLGLATTRVPILNDATPWPEDGPAPDAAVTTPGEIASFLHRLLRGELLREPSLRQLAAWLQVPEELDPVALSLPEAAQVFTKLGELDDAANVAGWVTTRQGNVILAVFSEDTDPGSAREAIGQLSLQIYAHYNG